MQSDIVQLARERAISYRDCGPSAEHTAAMLNELASHVERLRTELAASTEENIDLFKQLVAMRQQRDEARRMWCRIISLQRRGARENFFPEDIAVEYGWEYLYKEGGGA